MKDLLILLLLAFVSVSTLECGDLKSQFTFDEVSDCGELTATGSTLKLLLRNVDDARWGKLVKNSKFMYIKKVDIVIEDSSITKIDLSKMKEIIESQIIVKNNPLLQSINIATSQGTTLTGLTIADNPKLEEFKMAAATTFDMQSKKIEITNNKMLKDVIIPTVKNLGGVEVKGNRHLSGSTLKQFKDFGLSSSSDYVQEEGECVFTKKIEDLGELKDCKYVEGDLKLANDVKGDAGETKLTRVGGDVDLGNLPKDKASFLKSTDVKGKTSGGSDGGSGGDSKKSGDSGGMGMGLIIGIIAGVVVVVLIITVIAVYCYLKKKSGKGKKGKPAKKGKPTDEQTTTFEGDTGGGKKKKKGADKKKKAQSPAAASASQSASVATTPDPLNPGKGVPLRDDGIDLASEDDGEGAKKKTKK